MASGGENFGYNGKKNTTEVSGWNNENSVGSIRNTGVGNGLKLSARSMQEPQSAPVPSPRSEVQPSNYGYSESGDNNRNSLANIRNVSNTGMGSRNKISAQSAQEQQSAPVPSRSEVQPSSGGNYGYNESGDNKGNLVRNIGNISNTGPMGSRSKISAQSAQEQLSAPVPFPRSGVQPFSEGNYGYSGSRDNKMSVSGWSYGNPMENIQNNTREGSGWSNGNPFRNISNTGDGNGNKISAQSAQEQKSAPIPSPRSGVQSEGNYGYSASDDNNGNSVGNIENISNTGVGNLNKISAQLAQEQWSAPVPSLKIGVLQPSSGGNCGHSASDGNNGNPMENIEKINNSTGVGNRNKILAQTAPPVPCPWSEVQHSGGGNYGHSASGYNEMSVSGWSKGNSVGNIRNTGVGHNNEESTPRSSCCSCLICS